MKTEQFLQKCMNTILHSNINLFEEIMKPNAQIKPPLFSFFMFSNALKQYFLMNVLQIYRFSI